MTLHGKVQYRQVYLNPCWQWIPFQIRCLEWLMLIVIFSPVELEQVSITQFFKTILMQISSPKIIRVDRTTQ